LGVVLHTLGAVEVTEGVSEIVEDGTVVELATVEDSVELAAVEDSVALGFPAHPSPGTAMSNA
jgi:hypothetical protein